MELQFFSIYDRITGNYGNMFFAANIDDAKRRAGVAFKDNPYRGDFELYHCGAFNQEHGLLSAFDKPVFLCSVVEVIGE
ncbi:nonstructural protein [Sigmofec virus UA08Rod_6488]|uniref:Nonstructural protein n=1 Tax=Sigmofec virus UA08Rod_6488 TaxID=2929232 RepID=A0A976N0Z7_9VIRU|nr:nonstructural protein [Sigmofec virus UA08Rod_6488]